MFETLLIDRIDNPQNKLAHTLGEHIAIQFARTLGNQSHPKAKFTAFTENCAQHPLTLRGFVGRGKAMGLLNQNKDWIG